MDRRDDPRRRRLHQRRRQHQSRLCYIRNVVQANLLAACAEGIEGATVYNVACGQKTSLLELFGMLRSELGRLGIEYAKDPVHRDFRAGDVHTSLADIGKAQRELGYAPTHDIAGGLAEAMAWYAANLQ